MATEYKIPQINITDIKNILFKGDRTVPKSRIIAVLHSLKIEDSEKLDLFAKIIFDPTEKIKHKHLAISGLSKMDTKEAHKILSEALSKVKDDSEIAPLVRALVHKGTKQDIEQLSKLNNSITNKHARQQIDFAINLISYREGLGLKKIQFPLQEELLKLGPDIPQTTFKIVPAIDSMVKKIQAAQKDGSFGINISENQIFLIKCKPHDWAIALNENFDDKDKLLRIGKEPALLGQYLMYNDLMDSFSPSLVIISTPKEGNEVELLLKDVRGVTRYAGSAEIHDQKITFKLQTVMRPGAIPIELEGTYSKGKIMLENSVSSSTVVYRNRPKALVSV